MGKNPAFQFYPSDWSRDLEEHPLEIEGAWIRICCKLWWEETRGRSTKKIENWARILREKNKKTMQIISYLDKQNIADVLIENDDITISCRRMIKDEYIRNIRACAGSKGGNPALLKKDVCLSKENKQNPTPSSSVLLSSTSVLSTPLPPKGGNGSLPSPPMFISKEIWNDFIRHRKTMKAPLTGRACQLIWNKLEKWKEEKEWNPDDILCQSIERGWKGVFELQINDDNQDDFWAKRLKRAREMDRANGITGTN